jgi:hypothetical protein
VEDGQRRCRDQRAKRGMMRIIKLDCASPRSERGSNGWRSCNAQPMPLRKPFLNSGKFALSCRVRILMRDKPGTLANKDQQQCGSEDLRLPEAL